MKFMVLDVALPMDHNENLDRSFLYGAPFFVIRMFAICKKCIPRFALGSL